MPTWCNTMENAKLSLTSKTRFKARYQLITKTHPKKGARCLSLCGVRQEQNNCQFCQRNCASNRNKQAFTKPTKDSTESTLEDFSGNVIDSTSKTFKKYEFELFNKNLLSMS